MGTAREVLLAERGRVLRGIAALEREFAGIAEAASAGGTDDEHDPEGATVAFERRHRAGRGAHRRAPTGCPPGRADLCPVRGPVGLAARRALTRRARYSARPLLGAQ